MPVNAISRWNIVQRASVPDVFLLRDGIRPMRKRHFVPLVGYSGDGYSTTLNLAKRSSNCFCPALGKKMVAF